VTMETPFLLDCTGRKVHLGDSFSYATRRGSRLEVNLFRLDSVDANGRAKATIIGGPGYWWRAQGFDSAAGAYREKIPKQSTLLQFSFNATLIGEPRE
jgi:hypothetical protein